MMKIPEGYLSRQQAADLLGVHPRTIDRYADLGQLLKHTQNYRVYFLREDVDKLAQVQPVAVSQAR
jgi:DNA-binding transcriptional MerR regulator